jgi:hypothetical protein
MRIWQHFSRRDRQSDDMYQEHADSFETWLFNCPGLQSGDSARKKQWALAQFLLLLFGGHFVAPDLLKMIGLTP